MSYYSRVYRQRNPPMKDEGKKEPFFSQHDQAKSRKRNSFFQAKLAVNEPGDSYEKEADAVANSVVNKSSGKPMVQQKEISPIQRLATTKEEERVSSNDERMERDKEKPFQRKTDEPENKQEKDVQMKGNEDKKEEKKVQASEEPMKDKDKKVQMKDDPMVKEEDKKKSSAIQRKTESNSVASAASSAKIESSSGQGKQMPAKTLHDMNARFGADFSRVKVHDDNDAAELNHDLDAKAFTHGNDIYFGRSNFNPETAAGQFLLAHELTHVIQQNGARIQRDATPALPKFDFPVALGFFKNFDAIYSPDIIKPQEGTITFVHNIAVVFDKKIDAARQQKFRSDFKTNVQSLWQDKFLFELADPAFTQYVAHVKLDIEFVDDAKNAHTIMEVKDFPDKHRSSVEGRTAEDFPSLSHTAHLDTRDPSPEELAKKNKGKSIIEPSLVQYVGNFDFDSFEINEDCKKGVDRVEKEIDSLPEDGSSDEISIGNRIDYIGRASPEGNKWYNIELSKKRAKAVKKQIESDKPKAKKILSNLSGEGADKTENEAIKENYRRVNVLVFPMTPFSKLKDKDQNTAAHEFGHMIGFGDEYNEKGDKKFEKKVEGDRPSHYEDVKSIMGQAAADELTMSQSSSMMSVGNDIKKGHYAYFLKAIRDLTGKQGWTIK